MKLLILLVFPCLLTGMVPLRAVEAPVQAELLSEYQTVTPGQPFDVLLHLKIREHWHTYGSDPGEAGLPTSIVWKLPPGFKAGPIQWPKPSRFDTGGLISNGYTGEAYHLVTITPPAGLKPDTDFQLLAHVEWLACAEICQPGQADLTLNLSVGASSRASSHAILFQEVRKTILSAAGTVPASNTAARHDGLIWQLLLAFLGGLILNLMPCVFPVLGIKILGFVNQAGEQKRKVVQHGLVFTSGILLSFWLLAGVLIALRSSGQQLGWGFQLQSPGFVYFLVIVLFLFALSLSGVFEFGGTLGGIGASLASKSNLTGSFFSGVLATVVATPCAAPFLAPALGAALALSPLPSLLLFTFMALGLALPYLFLSLNPAMVRLLPRPGAWMETLRQFMAFPLYATAAFLLWVLEGQISETVFRNVLLSLAILGLAAWIYGRWSGPVHSPGTRRFCLLAGAAVLFSGLWFGWPTSAGSSSAASEKIHWLAWSPAAVDKYRAEAKPVYVDFTARWCATCQTNKAVVFGSREVLAKFKEMDVIALKADWTSQNTDISRELARWGRVAVPFNLLYLPGREKPVVLPELLTPGVVLDALNGK